jgi:heme exporter protein D
MIDLGRYAFAVLASYGVGLALLGGLVWHTLAANARARRALETHERRSDNG